MISVQTIAVAAAATGLSSQQQSRLWFDLRSNTAFCLRSSLARWLCSMRGSYEHLQGERMTLRATAKDLFISSLKTVDAASAMARSVAVSREKLRLGASEYLLSDFDKIIVIAIGKAAHIHVGGVLACRSANAFGLPNEGHRRGTYASALRPGCVLSSSKGATPIPMRRR